MVVRDFQSRLAMKHGIIQRKIIDNQISLAANPTDCIRVKIEKNYLGDIDSRIVESADIVPVIWPPLKDIPIRKIGQNGSGQYTITSMEQIQMLGKKFMTNMAVAVLKWNHLLYLLMLNNLVKKQLAY